MNINRRANFNLLILMVLALSLAMILMFLLLFFSIDVFFHFKNGWDINFGTAELTRALKIGVPIGFIIAIGIWFIYRFNIH